MSIRSVKAVCLAVASLTALHGCSLLHKTPQVQDAQGAAQPLPAEFSKAFSEGLELLKDGEYEAAEVHWTGLTEQYPQFPGNWLNLAIAQYRLEKYEPSLSSTEKAQAIDAGFCPAHKIRALDERELGKFREAETSYQAAIACNPSDMDAHYNLGVLYDLYLHDLGKAVQEYQTVQAANAQPDETLAMWITDLERRNAEQVAGEGS